MLSDILSNRRGCSPETSEKISNALRSSGARITGLQENGHKIGKSMQLNLDNMAAIHLRHDKQRLEAIYAYNNDHNCGTFELRHNSTKNLSNFLMTFRFERLRLTSPA